jgi:hypothetical protein
VALAGFVAGLIAMRYVVIYMPEDYFVRKPGAGLFDDYHPIVCWSYLIAKNLLGVGFLVAGATMIITPGPGILFLLLGLSLVNLPGKRQLELRLLRVRGVKLKIDELRRKHHRPILQIPPK